ncbi:MAG: hypothetical protein PSV46_07180 [Reyranella sp.]|nr:hypothetical protein [Reyranella sp.]
MAIHLDISRLNRLVMVVIIGDARAGELLALAHQFADADMMPYPRSSISRPPTCSSTTPNWHLPPPC